MTEDDLIRERLKELLKLKSLNALRLCRLYEQKFPKDAKPLRHQTLTKFLRGPKRGGTSHLRDDTREKIESVLGESLVPEVLSSAIEASRQTQPGYLRLSGSLRPDEIPLVYVWEFPRGIPEGQMRTRLIEARRGAYRRASTDPPDPDLVWVRLREKLGERMMPGDDVLISPAAGEHAHDGSFVLVETMNEVLTGELRIVEGRRAVRTKSGRRFEEGQFKIRGLVVRFTGAPE